MSLMKPRWNGKKVFLGIGEVLLWEEGVDKKNTVIVEKMLSEKKRLKWWDKYRPEKQWDVISICCQTLRSKFVPPLLTNIEKFDWNKYNCWLLPQIHHIASIPQELLKEPHPWWILLATPRTTVSSPSWGWRGWRGCQRIARTAWTSSRRVLQSMFLWVKKT